MAKGSVRMTQRLASQILTSDSDEIADLKANLETLEGFIDLARKIDGLPNTKSRFFEESRSLYQITATLTIDKLEALLTEFFGPPVKPSGKPLPRKLRKDSVVKYLGGIQKDQSLFIISLKTGQFYGALWPWRRNKSKIEIHLGYCSDWMGDDDYEQLETLVKQSISRSTFEQMDAGIGGQIHGISLPSFLQMAEMEKSSFSLRITSRNRLGSLHLNEGVLIAADLDDTKGKNAAFEIISWDDASIEIEPLDKSKTDEIKLSLMQVLMESLKLKDEAVVSQVASEKNQAQPEEEDTPQPNKKPTPRSQRPSPSHLVRLERAPEPKIKRQRVSILTLAAMALGTIGIIAVVYMASHHFATNRKASDGYQTVTAKVNKQPLLEEKIALLQKYLDEHPGSKHTMEIQNQLIEISETLQAREFEKVELSISAFPVNEHYEKKAVAAYESFLEKYPGTRYEKDIRQSIFKIKDLIDQHYYHELKHAARLNFNDRLKIYRDYLTKFPMGNYSKDVEVLIEDMGSRYLEYLSAETVQCEAKQKWAPCIKQLDDFIAAYQGMPLGTKANRLKKGMVDKRDFLQIRRQVLETGTDYQKGYQLYQSYLAKNPQSTQKAAVKKEMDELSVHLKGQKQWLSIKRFAGNSKNALINRIKKVEQYLHKNASGPFAGDAHRMLGRLEAERKLSLRQQQIQAQKRKTQEQLQREKTQRIQREARVRRLQVQLQSQLNASSRFRIKGNNAVVDQTTGLTWALLDSQQELGGCLSYEAAKEYVQSLRLDGNQDWRLPTASELASIFKKPPFYPSAGNQWFWSSETYVKGYHSVGVVVTDKPETRFEREHRNLSECGVVRAVR